MMKITSIEARRKDYQLAYSYKFATCEKQTLEYIIVRIKTNEGIVGYGECPVAWHPFIETCESTLQALGYIETMLVGKDPIDIETITQICNQNIRLAHAARCGIDMALYDIRGKKEGVQVGNIFAHEKIRRVPLNALIPMSSFETSVEKARLYFDQSYKTYKVKVGVDLSEELRLVEKIREIVGPDNRLFIDANQGWKTPVRAIECIKRFEPFNIAWVEQPILKTDIDGLKHVKENVSTPIMADESLFSVEDAEKMVSIQAVDMFNIKLAKVGGLNSAEKIYSIAKQHNIPCMIGSYIESPLGALAGYHFIRPHDIIATDIGGWELIQNPFPSGLRNERGYMLLEGNRPGLGYALEMEHLLQREFEKNT